MKRTLPLLFPLLASLFILPIHTDEVPEKPGAETKQGEQPATPESATDFRKALEAAAAALQGNNAAEADRLIETLSTLNAQPTLADVLNEAEADIALKKVALRALTHNGSESAAQAVLDAVRQSEDEAFLGAASAALGELSNPEASPALLAAAIDGTDSRLNSACSLALARMPGQEPAEALLKAYVEGVTDAGNREVIARGIAAIRAPEAVSPMVSAVQTWQEDGLALAALSALSSMGSCEAVEALFKLADDGAISGNPERVAAVRHALSSAVAEHEEVEGVVDIALARLEAQSDALRMAAAHAVSRLVDSETVLRALAKAKKSEANREVLAMIETILAGREDILVAETPPETASEEPAPSEKEEPSLTVSVAPIPPADLAQDVGEPVAEEPSYGNLLGLAAAVLVIVALLGVFTWRLRRRPKQAAPALPAEDIRELTLKLEDGQTFPVRVGRYIHAYSIQLRSGEYEYDLSQPTEVLDALWSTPRHDPNKYLSLLDEAARKKMQEMDKDSWGFFLAPDSQGKESPKAAQEAAVFTHWVETTLGTKAYRILCCKETLGGQEFPGVTVTLVKEGDKWLQSFDLEQHPLLKCVGPKSYEELERLCESAEVPKPGM